MSLLFIIDCGKMEVGIVTEEERYLHHLWKRCLYKMKGMSESLNRQNLD